MRSKTTRAKAAGPRGPIKLLLWAAVASLLFGLIGMGEIAEDGLRVLRNSLHPQKVSGDIVFVGVDEKGLREIGEWPWPRSTQARLVDEAQRLGATRVFIDLIYDGKTRPEEDAALAAAIERSVRAGTSVTLVTRERSGGARGETVDGRPIPTLGRHARLASVGVRYNYQTAAWQVPYSAVSRHEIIPSFAAALAREQQGKRNSFRVDYSFDPDTIPYLSATDLLAGRASGKMLAGKSVVIGLNNDELGDRYWIPGNGRMAGAVIQVLGAETLKKGSPVDLGWLIAFAVTLAVTGWAVLRSSGRLRAALLAAFGGTLLALPVLLEANLVFVDVVPSLFLLAIISARLSFVRWRTGELTNRQTGLPNLAALRKEKRANELALVAARVQNFAEITSTLPSDSEQRLVHQLVNRLSALGTADVFQGDEGIFAWYTEPDGAIGNHLEALHAMFRSPISIDKRSVDVAVTFGVEIGSNRPIASRLGSALVAADEAWDDGLRWKYHDPARQEEVSWRLSLLGQLDAAIDNGEVWIAYQPQYDLRSGTVIGAEALARWTHPEKGPISPSEFIAAAEQHGRIGKLTDFVLDRSIATAAAINRRGIAFTVAVNMSARLLSDRQLLDRVQMMLKAHGLNPDRLTLELTETEALHGADGAIAMLDALRSTGVRIAIDDYGTGLSTLEYLKKVPANEIKIDQSFIKAMRVNRSDLIMVQSTIALAHSLGRTVVAEGVEDRQCLEELAAMGCDVAQGYIVGRPMGVRELVQRLHTKHTRRVA